MAVTPIIILVLAVAWLAYRLREERLTRGRRVRRRDRNQAYQQFWAKIVSRPKLKRISATKAAVRTHAE